MKKVMESHGIFVGKFCMNPVILSIIFTYSCNQYYQPNNLMILIFEYMYVYVCDVKLFSALVKQKKLNFFSTCELIAYLHHSG